MLRSSDSLHPKIKLSAQCRSSASQKHSLVINSPAHAVATLAAHFPSADSSLSFAMTSQSIPRRSLFAHHRDRFIGRRPTSVHSTIRRRRRSVADNRRPSCCQSASILSPPQSAAVQTYKLDMHVKFCSKAELPAPALCSKWHRPPPKTCRSRCLRSTRSQRRTGRGSTVCSPLRCSGSHCPPPSGVA